MPTRQSSYLGLEIPLLRLLVWFGTLLGSVSSALSGHKLASTDHVAIPLPKYAH
ncbi:hypothetical protein ASPFODRAFT_39259 [Aspergillus luchuensis CBS 106.47]|uniref:Uncharacterized protein n=1 Tax=Aspergillus luchuensis (strain CBS 106.47) TaxID=1137211 RepID=A0A1M3TZH9_ASPLC|nr:hypothetical protein ASPFODRAFT_39259 [Aspergillus luchuensis CBS 106.47]